MNSNLTEKSLVLVVGAGASKEVNLPVGAELKKQIAKVLNIQYEHFHKTSGDDIINDSFMILSTNRDIQPYLDAACRVRDAMPQAISIDNFIDSHQLDEKISICGKLAIARCILTAESKSLLKIDRSNIYNKPDFSALEPTWFNAFFQLLTERCQQADLPERLSKVAIISFNYDRCIEHYLFWSFQNYYGMTAKEASEVLTHLEIHHPYGMVGKLPWQQGAHEQFEFGDTPIPKKLLSLAGELRTFTEGIDPTKSDISAIQAALSTAQRIAFLGFAFHRQNIELLLLGQNMGGKERNCRVYATAYGISSPDIRLIKQDIISLAGISDEHIYVEIGLKCSELFSEFWRSLSLQ
jgi:hypothetical protein